MSAVMMGHAEAWLRLHRLEVANHGATPRVMGIHDAHLKPTCATSGVAGSASVTDPRATLGAHVLCTFFPDSPIRPDFTHIPPRGTS